MMSDDTLLEIARNGRYCRLAAQHLNQLAMEFEAEASFAELQFKAAILLAPETTDSGPGPDWPLEEKS
jgi:hypothetical protein